MDAETEQGMLLRQNAPLRLYYKQDSSKRQDTKWCLRVAELDYVLLKVGILQLEKDGQ